MPDNFNKAFAMAKRIFIESDRTRINLLQVSPSRFDEDSIGIEILRCQDIDRLEDFGEHVVQTHTIRTFKKVRAYAVTVFNDDNVVIIEGEAVVTSILSSDQWGIDRLGVALTNEISMCFVVAGRIREMKITTEKTNVFNVLTGEIVLPWVDSEIYLDGKLAEVYPIPATILLG